ncbi:uncharacterized protein [Elaeis guineensis]|uniref:uncharacterized protein isoform X10 n=1 Tax=Elaeis guineensis var. tenera TaxID=51953 RepID=UPI00094FFE96
MEVEDDEEEEDIDFNPFLKGETLSEASSGLSSDNEGLISKVDKILQRSQHKDATTSSRANMEIVCCSTDSGNEDEETVMQTRLASEDSYGKESISEKPTTRELTTSTEQGGGLTCDGGCIKELLCRDGSDAADLTKEEFLEQTTGSLNPRNFQDPIVEIDDEDAICKRTRAHHSLAHYTLEELEAFLQESDDDDDMQNPDDEEEYHKFLAAVLLEGADNKQTGQEHENVEEDEENDADFEIELEEALESDVDESTDNNRGLSDKQEEDRPETRHKKRLRESAENKNYSLGQAKMPLRTILPFVSNAQVAPFPPSGWQFSSPQSFTHCPPSFSGADLVNGFTSEQIGQLYCLIHEHVQLLIQVFSVCVLDPSRQQVAFQVRKMIMEMVDRHEEALACRKVPYPRSCFQPSNLCSSLHADFHQIPEFSNWTPLLDNLVLSVLDVAPLRLAKSYMTDVSEAVLRYRQNHVQDATDKSHLKRVPLFPLPMFASHSETNNDHLGRATTTSSKTASPSPAQVQPKKSLAATLVESTMKQSVALVPLDIARLAQKFFPLFNLALFPHKPPMPAVANRVLFTDAEDRLLAMGLMEYNNDWGAIHQHFLPCKTKHQIFVRQKNRSSSKAPENPIKAVRRMKTSPLTTDEKSQINEGLKLFKHDWLSIWKFFVPHRDPSLLPRQWRIATGTQKSYKKSEDDKEKRRLYEAKRRKIKASMTDKEVTSELEVDNGANSADDMDNEDEAFVHEAFLADSEHKFEASRQESEAGHELVTSSKPSSSKGGACECRGDFHDESLPEIVMEQEELSDSDEESEQVEFECEEMDDSEEDELDATQPSETPNKGIRAFAPVGEKIQADHKFNQCQSRSLTQGSVDKGKNYASPVQTCPGSCHDKLSRLKPKDGSAKRERSCRSSPNVSHSHLGRTSKARNSKNSKTTQRPHSQAVNEHETVASRKPRKRSVLN